MNKQHKLNVTFYILSFFFISLISLISIVPFSSAITWTQSNGSLINNYYNVTGESIWVNDTVHTWINDSYPQSMNLSFLRLGIDQQYIYEGRNYWGGGLLTDGYDDGWGTGAGWFQMGSDGNSYTGFSMYDWDRNYAGSSDRPTNAIWVGGANWGTNANANDMEFWVDDEYMGTNLNTVYMTMRLFPKITDDIPGVWIGSRDFNSNAWNYAQPRYALDVGDGDIRIRGTNKMGFGGDKDNDYTSAISDDGSTMQFENAINGFNFNNNVTAPNICYSNGTNCNTTNSSYYLASNPFSFYNVTTLPATNWTNVALTNITNNFTATQNITGSLNMVGANRDIYFRDTSGSNGNIKSNLILNLGSASDGVNHGNGYNDMILSTSNVARMTIKGTSSTGNTGFVGIGTTTPTVALDVNGSMNISALYGPETVVNGGFDTDTNWTKGAGWTISSGTANHWSNGTGSLNPTVAISPTVGQQYKLTYTVSNLTSNAVSVQYGGVVIQTIITNGTFTNYIYPLTTGNLLFTPSVTQARFQIDNVSVTNTTTGTGNLTVGGETRLIGNTSIDGKVTMMNDNSLIMFTGTGSAAKPNVFFNKSIRAGMYDNGYGVSISVNDVEALTISGDSGFVANAGQGSFKVSDGTRIFTFRPDVGNFASIRQGRYATTTSNGLNIYSYALDAQPQVTNYSRLQINATNGFPIIMESQANGTGNLTSLKLNFTNVNITSNLTVYNLTALNGNFTGNLTGSTYYGGMYFFNNSGAPFPFGAGSTWYNLSGLTCGYINGFTCNGTSGTLTVGQSGIYKVNYVATGIGANNHIYITAVAINSVIQNNTRAYVMASAGDTVSMTGIGHINVTATDTINLQIQDASGTSTGTVYNSNIVLERIGN